MSLAVQYRPRAFKDIKGQDATTKTLQRSIVTGKPLQVFLLHGHFGSGKTTFARVYAMALNCAAAKENAGEPCGTCPSCARIWAGHSTMDVHEMDAASNRGIEAAQDLRAEAQYGASHDGATKVYVIDECHMLTREAWAVHLKLLEEPPKNCVFIFCTTDPEKIASSNAPVLSRMAKFAINKLTNQDIEERLVEVATLEQLTVDRAVLKELAKRYPSPRDALMALDQMIAGDDLSIGALQQQKSGYSDGMLVAVAGVLYSGDESRVPKMADKLYENGTPDLQALFDGLGIVHNDVLEMQASKAIRSRVVEDSYQRQIFKLANEHPKPVVLAAAELWQQAEPIMRTTSNTTLAWNTYEALALSASSQIKWARPSPQVSAPSATTPALEPPRRTPSVSA